jgi:hypothetical protein
MKAQRRAKRGGILTAAERQAAYRERHLESGESVELRAVVPREFGDMLERLMSHHELTKRVALMRVIEEAEHRTLRRLKGAARRMYEKGGK